DDHRGIALGCAGGGATLLRGAGARLRPHQLLRQDRLSQGNGEPAGEQGEEGRVAVEASRGGALLICLLGCPRYGVLRALFRPASFCSTQARISSSRETPLA